MATPFLFHSSAKMNLCKTEESKKLASTEPRLWQRAQQKQVAITEGIFF